MPNPDAIVDLIHSWLGDRVVVEASTMRPDALQELYPEERFHLQKAVAKRRHEFATARSLARAALARIGVKPGALLPYPDRSPYWPEGVVGSITHTGSECVVVAGQSSRLMGIGVDLEEIRGVNSGMMDMILRPEERSRLLRLSREEQARSCLETFCAKEAFYKYQYPLTGEFLGFQAVEIVKEPHHRGFEIRIDPQSGIASRRVVEGLQTQRYRAWSDWLDERRVLAVVAQSVNGGYLRFQ